MASSQVLEDCWVSPEAVPTWIGSWDSCTFTLGISGLGMTLMHPSLQWPSLCFSFGVPALGCVCYSFFYMIEVVHAYFLDRKK